MCPVRRTLLLCAIAACGCVHRDAAPPVAFLLSGSVDNHGGLWIDDDAHFVTSAMHVELIDACGPIAWARMGEYVANGVFMSRARDVEPLRTGASECGGAVYVIGPIERPLRSARILSQAPPMRSLDSWRTIVAIDLDGDGTSDLEQRIRDTAADRTGGGEPWYEDRVRHGARWQVVRLHAFARTN